MVWKDRFEYISVVFFPHKFSLLTFMGLWCICAASIGQLWWLVDIQSRTVSILLSVFVDAWFRPLSLMLGALVLRLPLSQNVRSGATASSEEKLSLPTAPPGANSAPGDLLFMRHTSSDSITGFGREGSHFSNSTSDDPPRQQNVSKNEVAVPEQQRPQPTPSDVNSSDGFGGFAVFDVARAYFVFAREYVAGGEDFSSDPAIPWESRARWKVIVRSRSIAISIVVYVGFIIAMIIWEMSQSVSLCIVNPAPESSACIQELAEGTHIRLIRPRVFDVIHLFVSSTIFVFFAVSGVMHLENLHHRSSRLRFRSTLTKLLLFQGLCVFAAWCVIFTTVRYSQANAFFCFLDNVAAQALIWTFAWHTSTAANRQATGPIADWLHVLQDEFASVITAIRTRIAFHHPRDEKSPPTVQVDGDAPRSRSSSDTNELSLRSTQLDIQLPPDINGER